MKSPKLKTVVIASMITVAGALACAVIMHRPSISLMRRTGDAARYKELHRAGEKYQRVWTGQLRIADHVEALLHLSSPSEYFSDRLKTEKQALLGSGYLVQVRVHVPNLEARLAQVKASLSNTLQQTGAYYEAQLDWKKNEVRLVCRKADVSLWRRVLNEDQPIRDNTESPEPRQMTP